MSFPTQPGLFVIGPVDCCILTVKDAAEGTPPLVVYNDIEEGVLRVDGDGALRLRGGLYESDATSIVRTKPLGL